MCDIFFFLRLKKEDITYSRGRLSLQPSPSAYAATSPEGRGFKRLYGGRAVPGRNYKLLPALATNSPPDCLLNASRPALRYLVIIMTLTFNFLKSLLCFAREVASSDSEEDGGIVWRETTGLPYRNKVWLARLTNNRRIFP